jgi:hypothetical protein
MPNPTRRNSMSFSVRAQGKPEPEFDLTDFMVGACIATAILALLGAVATMVSILVGVL